MTSDCIADNVILKAVAATAESLIREDWEDQIPRVLERLAKAVNVSRVYVFRNHRGEHGGLLTSQRFEWAAPGVTPQINNPDLQDADLAQTGFQRWIEELGAGRCIHGVVRDLPASERECLSAQGILSIVAVPIFSGADWWGFLGFDDCARSRHWSGPEIAALKTTGYLFGIALQNTRLRDLEQRLIRQATHDDLTGLPNRRAIREQVERCHARALRRGSEYALALVDIDRFKLINDSCGHASGDRVLGRVAEILRCALRTGDMVGRWGGEEFLCVLPDTGLEDAVRSAERLRREVTDTVIEVAGRPLDHSVSIGVAAKDSGDGSWDDVLARADAALYRAKSDGRDRVRSSLDVTHDPVSMAATLHRALRDGRIQPAYQPIVELESGRVVAEETLARLIQEDGCVMPAAQFIDVASRMQLSHTIDAEMLRVTMTRCAREVLTGSRRDHFVNMSADLLRHPDLMEEIMGFAAEQCALCGDRVASQKPVVIELTERELFEDLQQAREAIAPFTEFGVRLAIDDFGSGYSSFQYLVHLPVSFLKIDGDLVRLLTVNPRVRAIIRSIQRTARDLEILTVAERVEDSETVDILRDIGVNWAQGYHFGRPVLDSDAGVRPEQGPACFGGAG